MFDISHLKFCPLTSDRWNDLEKLFGEKGACGGCWCMYWRLSYSEFQKQIGDGNKEAFKRLVYSGKVPGILAYAGDEPVGWCSVAPREVFPKLEHSRILKRVDDKPVWSVVCFFVAKPFRHRGLSIKMLEAVVDYVRCNGGRIVEGYPVEAEKKQPGAFLYTGIASAYRKAGFAEVARRSPTRPIMRYHIK